MAYKQNNPKNDWNKRDNTSFSKDSEKDKRKKESERRRSKRKRDNYYDDDDDDYE